MAARELKAREGEEIWETTTEGRIWVPTVDDRGRENVVSVGGKVGSKLRLKTLDREIAQDRVMDGSDPFTNGLLRRVDDDQAKDPRTASPHALSTDELLVGFSKSGMAFRSFIDKLGEVNVRRMADMAEAVDASQSQVAYLNESIRTRFRVEGDTPTYREMKAQGEL